MNTTIERADAREEAALTCEHCHTVGAHALNCPVMLHHGHGVVSERQAYENRVAYAAHIYAPPYSLDCWKRCEAKGISSDEFEAGIRLREAREEERRKWIAWYGAPEYGGWRMHNGRHMPVEVIEAGEQKARHE